MSDNLTPEQLAEIEQREKIPPSLNPLTCAAAYHHDIGCLLAHIRALEEEIACLRMALQAVNHAYQGVGDLEGTGANMVEIIENVRATLDTYDRLAAAERRGKQEQAIVEAARAWRDTYYDLDAEPADLERAGNAVIAAVDALKKEGNDE